MTTIETRTDAGNGGVRRARGCAVLALLGAIAAGCGGDGGGGANDGGGSGGGSGSDGGGARATDAPPRNSCPGPVIASWKVDGTPYVASTVGYGSVGTT